MAEDEVLCPCCKIYYLRREFVSFYDGVQPLICRDCVNHQGDDWAVKRARGKHHGQMLTREYATGRERVLAAEKAVEEMQRELNMRPVQTVVRVENLDKIIVEEARTLEAEAYFRRDKAMGCLSDVRLLHHRNPERKEMCVCRLRYENCKIALLVDQWPGVLSWERSEAGKHHRGQRHGLKRDHPALSDDHYFDTVYGSQHGA